MPFMGYPGYPMAYGYPMASQPVAGSATAQQPAPQMMTYQAPQFFQAPQYVAPQMEYQVGCLSSCCVGGGMGDNGRIAVAL